MDTKINIEKLNNNNFFQWKYKIKMFLKEDELWEVISNETPTSASGLRTWNREDEKAQAIIALSVEDSQLVHIREKENAIDMWNALKAAHELDTVTNKVLLRQGKVMN